MNKIFSIGYRDARRFDALDILKQPANETVSM